MTQSKYAHLYKQNVEMNSVVSYPRRCPLWGDARYRGNCDGTLFKELVLRYRPRRVADPMMGSGTTRDVIEGLNRNSGTNIEYWGSDLRHGFNLLCDDLPGTFNLVWIHPPYWNIIRYNLEPADLSTFDRYDEFVAALRVCLTRCTAALIPGGLLAVLIGDVRKRGTYTPIIRDVLMMEPELGKLRSIIIKGQHNCRSDSVDYSRMPDVPIKHEYCVIFERTS